MSRPRHLGTYLSDMREARHWVRFRTAHAKATAHRRFRHRTRQALRCGIWPAEKMGFGYYL